MRQNICKFIQSEEYRRLIVKEYIYEQNSETLESAVCLRTYRVYLIAEGAGVLSVDGRCIPLVAGTLCFCFPGETVVFREIKGMATYYLSFEGGRAEDLFWRFGISPEHRCFGSFRPLLSLWQETLLSANDRNLDLVSESVLLYTFSRLARAEGSNDRMILELLHYMEEHFSDSSLTLSRAAERCGYHPKYLSHRFKECTGVGFHAYLRGLRIRNATFLFDHGLDSVKNVSLLCGFSDALYFSRVFKEQLGVSPREYILGRSADKNDTVR